MTRRLAQQFVIIACALALLVFPLAPVVDGTVAASTNAFHWGRKQSEFRVKAGNNVNGGWNSLLRTAISQWNKSDVVTIKESSGRSNPQNCRETVGRIEVCSGNYGKSEGWLGLTRLFFRRGHIEAATVQMNDSYFQDSSSQYFNQDARRHTICHELGHAIGLDHVDTRSCMNNSQYAVFNYIKPINKDFRQLARIYKHKDSVQTVKGKQKKDKKKKDRKKRKNQKDGKNKKSKRDKKKERRKKRKERRQKLRERRRAARASSAGFFDPTALPSVPSGLVGDETVTIESLDDGRTIVSFITWADD